jgi:S-adenosylmethionine synthetase
MTPLRESFDLPQRRIMGELDLRRPIYRKTAAHWHFGPPLAEFTGEQTRHAKSLCKRLLMDVSEPECAANDFSDDMLSDR